MVEMTVVYNGELRCVARHGPSAAEVTTDAPTDNQGRGESFSPTDLVASALGSCMLTIMGIRARTEGWEIAGTRLSVQKGMVADPLRRIGRLEVEIEIPCPGREAWSERARAVLEKAAMTCPVFQSLNPQIDIPVSFHWSNPDDV